MAKTCSWCGEKIGFTDVAYDWVETDTNSHWICGKCCREISLVKKGNTTFEDIATDKTDPDLFSHFEKQEKKSEKEMQREKLMKEHQRIKKEAQQTNPLYDDIHQIAGDLRFIKNYLIFCIVAGVTFGLLYLFSIL